MEVINVQVLYLILLLGALVCFILATLNLRTERPVNWVAVGLGLWVLVPIIQMAQRL